MIYFYITVNTYLNLNHCAYMINQYKLLLYYNIYLLITLINIKLGLSFGQPQKNKNKRTHALAACIPSCH